VIRQTDSGEASGGHEKKEINALGRGRGGRRERERERERERVVAVTLMGHILRGWQHHSVCLFISFLLLSEELRGFGSFRRYPPAFFHVTHCPVTPHRQAHGGRGREGGDALGRLSLTDKDSKESKQASARACS